MHVLLCHSVLGLRDVEREAAERLRRAGHIVSVPDLFGGSTPASIAEGAEIVDRIGWSSVCEAAERALQTLPADAVLAGFSMGVGVASELWARRPLSAGALFLHALPTIPPGARLSFRFEVHVGETDTMFAGTRAIDALARAARDRPVSAQIYRYPAAGHFFTDPTLPEFDPAATTLTWDRVLRFLGGSPRATVAAAGERALLWVGRPPYEHWRPFSFPAPRRALGLAPSKKLSSASTLSCGATAGLTSRLRADARPSQSRP